MARVAWIIGNNKPSVVSCGWFDQICSDYNIGMKSSTAERKLRMLRYKYTYDTWEYKKIYPGYVYLPATKQLRFYSHFVKWCGKYTIDKTII